MWKMQKQPFPVRGGGSKKFEDWGGGYFCWGWSVPHYRPCSMAQKHYSFCINKAKLFAKGFSKHIVCTPLFCWEVQPPTKFSKERGLTGPQPLDAGCWERGKNFFYLKNKFKSEKFKACVHYFSRNFHFSLNDSPSKTERFFISSTKLFSFARYSNYCISTFPFFSACQSSNCLNRNLITHFVLYLEKEKRYDIESLAIDTILNKEHFYGKTIRKCTPKATLTKKLTDV